MRAGLVTRTAERSTQQGGALRVRVCVCTCNMINDRWTRTQLRTQLCFSLCLSLARFFEIKFSPRDGFERLEPAVGKRYGFKRLI